MKVIFSKILSIFLALIVLLSTMSFTVDKHYCGEFLVDVSFTGKAEGCGMKMDNVATTKKKNCCKDEVHQIDGQDELQQQLKQEFSFENQQFLVSFVKSYQDLFYNSYRNVKYYKDFSPPDIPIDYQSTYQVYII